MQTDAFHKNNIFIEPLFLNKIRTLIIKYENVKELITEFNEATLRMEINTIILCITWSNTYLLARFFKLIIKLKILQTSIQ